MSKLKRLGWWGDGMANEEDGPYVSVGDVHDALASIVAQLRACGYECKAGKLEYNAAFRELEQMVEQAHA